MGKIISFELKKLVSRIGIYILVVLMAGLLVAGTFMYDPIERKTTSLSIVGDTVTEMYSTFNNIVKDEYLTSVAEVADNAETYVTSSADYMKYNNAEEIEKLFVKFDEYCRTFKDANATAADYSILLKAINNSLQDLKSALDEGLNHSKNKTGYYILSTNDDYKQLFVTINNISSLFTPAVALASPKAAGETYFNEYRRPLYDSLQTLVYPKLNDTAIKYTENGTYYAIITLRMDEIAGKMEQLNDKAVLDQIINKDAKIKEQFNELFNRYVNCSLIFEKSYASSMCVDALYSVKSKTARGNLIGYGNISLYEQEETSAEYKYYIENHSNPDDYANSLSVTHTSNGKANAYDFTFYIMSIFSVLVIIFAVYLSAHTISGEINNNTMRFTALRPVKRGSIFFGKYLAIMIMSLILLLFGTITSFIVGGVVYGFGSANILMIINSADVIVAHPMIVLAIFVLSLLLIVAVYAALTIMLSALFKSDLLAMIVGVIVYLVNLVLPLFFGAGSWLRFYPLANINIFAYFGTSSLTADTVLGNMFNAVVYHGMSLWISLVYIIGFTLLLLVIGKTIFKKREL